MSRNKVVGCEWLTSVGLFYYQWGNRMKRSYWYKIHHYNCPVCGKHTREQERVYDKPKPEKWEDRNEIMSDSISYDWCDVGVY